MYLSKDGMSFLWMLHNAPISRTSPKKNTQEVLSVMSNVSWNTLKWGFYSRAKISCCLVSEEPLVGKKFSSNNDTFKERKKKDFYKNVQV